MVSGEQPRGAGRVEVDEPNESGSRALVRRQLGGAIRRRRHAASLTLATVSERAGISVSMLSQVERGLLDPSLDTLRNIADALGTAPFRLLAEEGSAAGVVRRGERRIIEGERRRSAHRTALAVGRGRVRDQALGAAAGRLADRRRARACRRGGQSAPARARAARDRRRADRAGRGRLRHVRPPQAAPRDRRRQGAGGVSGGDLPARGLTVPAAPGRLAFGSGGCDHVCFPAYFSVDEIPVDFEE